MSDSIHTYICSQQEWFPYGPLSCVVPVIAAIACCLYLFSAFDCFTFIAKGTDSTTGRPYEVNVGYWGVEDLQISIRDGPDNDGNVCKPWGEPELFDGAWKFGKALGILGTFMTISLSLLDFFLFLVPLPQLWLFLMGLWHLLNCGMAGFLLFGLKSRICDGWIFDCTIGTGGIFAIISCVLWFLDFVLFMCLREQEIKLGGGGYIQRAHHDDDKQIDEEKLAIEEDYEEEQAPRSSPRKALPQSRVAGDDAASVPSSIKLISLDAANGDKDDEDDDHNTANRSVKPLRRIKSEEPTSSTAIVHRKSDTKRTDMPGTPRANRKLLSQSAHGSTSAGSRGSARRSQTVEALVSPRRTTKKSLTTSPRPGRKSSKINQLGHMSLPAGLDLDDDGDTDIESMAQHSKTPSQISKLPPPPRKGLF